jgi:hypothetical protein
MTDKAHEMVKAFIARSLVAKVSPAKAGAQF